MIQDVRLYIDDKLVDFSNELNLSFTYQLEDLNNPTIIKNSFTKTITILGTSNNNKIFGEIYNFDRNQLYDPDYLVGVYFNPSFRTPFKLYRNGELIENGYMQLNSVTIKNKIINYEITLYGGLGDFFYNLSYNADNEPLKLSDLKYGVNGIDNSDNEFDMVINKNTIKNHWEKLNTKTTTRNIEDFITFIPSLNGLYEDFESNKVLINTNNSSVFTTSSTTQDGKYYTTYNGYALGEMKKELTEWEMNTLRSVNQRPALRIKGFIEACCNPENNGGYTVVLDNDFFNISNPYYQQSYIALPLLSNLLNINSETIDSTLKQNTTNAWCGDKNGTVQDSGYMTITPTSSFTVTDETINISNYAAGSTIDLDIDFQLFFSGDSTNDLYLTSLLSGSNADRHPNYNSILIQAVVVDINNPLGSIGYSDIYNFTNNTERGFSQPRYWSNWWNYYNADMKNVFGHFVYDSQIGKHYFLSDNNSNTFKIKIEKIPTDVDNIQIYLNIQRIGENNSPELYDGVYQTVGSVNTVRGYWDYLINSNESTMSLETRNEISSNIKVTKQNLLKTEKTPCDYLLSFTKLFGLYFTKDVTTKTIHILQRNNYFNGDVIDLTNKIDYSKDVVINPLLFNKKFYQLSNESPDNYYLDKYKKEYGYNYGQKRINTNYNFNSETEVLLKDNVYENSVSVLDTSYYYRSFFKSDGTSLPSFIVDNLTYKLFNGDETADIEIKGTDMVDISLTENWNVFGGYDYIDKLAFFTMNDDLKNLADISSCLVFYNGNIIPKTIENKSINLWVTDDLQEMYDLNDAPCYLYTEEPFDIRNRWIAYPLKELPYFSRFILSDNNVRNSWDFGVSKESYIPNIVYNDSATIYNKYLADFYTDQFDVNTKKVTVYVNLNEFMVNEDMLKKFYFFNNCYWLLNKIENYNINSYNTVKCEFIRVNNLTNYTKPLGDYYSYFEVDNSEIYVDDSSGTYTVTVNSTFDWEVFWYTNSKITNISVMSGNAGTTKIEVSYNANTTYAAENFYFSIETTNESERISVDFIQKPNSNTTVEVYGKITYYGNGIIPNGRIFISDATTDTVYDLKRLDEYTGEYKLYSPKNVPVRVSVQTTYGEEIYSSNTTFTANSELNLLLSR